VTVIIDDDVLLTVISTGDGDKWRGIWDIVCVYLCVCVLCRLYFRRPFSNVAVTVVDDATVCDIRRDDDSIVVGLSGITPPYQTVTDGIDDRVMT